MVFILLSFMLVYNFCYYKITKKKSNATFVFNQQLYAYMHVVY